METVFLYHGSSEIVEKPIYGKGKIYNDYGRGFYCTENLYLAKEWACTEEIAGYVNQYELDRSPLNILELSSEKYSILHWLALLMEYRKIRLSTPLMKRSAEWLRENFLINIDEYDVIIGYRADDSYFSFARSFANNEISLEQLNYAMRLGKLGEQFVLKSPKAFQTIKFVSYEVVDCGIYYARRKARDEVARKAFFAELEKEDLTGIYIRDLIRGEVEIHDARVQ